MDGRLLRGMLLERAHDHRVDLLRGDRDDAVLIANDDVAWPHRAAVVAAVYAILVGGVVLPRAEACGALPCFLSTVRTTAAVMLLVAASTVAAYLIAIADIPGQINAILAPFAGDRILLMAAIMVLVVIVGTALDFIPTILILTPILMPIVKQAGIDPV